MRARIKVMDLSLAQWDWLQDNLPETYAIPENAVRVCVEFELSSEIGARYVEMGVRQFIALMAQLQLAEAQAQGKDVRLPVLPTAAEVHNLTAAQAVALTQRKNEPTCDHGAAVAEESRSAFEGAEPVRTYADGCQSFGPYRSLDA